MKCEICNKEVDGLKGLSCHLVKYHKSDKKEYYDKYLKKENEGKCYFCNNEAKFFDLTRGYHKICNSKICLGKTRATGTSEFLMYKYGLSEKDAIILMNKRASERGEKITDGLQKSFEKNKKFFKEKSHQTIDFWLKKGYSQEEAEIEVKKVWDDIHEKTWNKRRNNPELYKDINTTHIEYWLKNGFTEDESKEKIKDRQKTFTLEKCIEKYGKIKGKEIWNSRQKKWKKSLVENGNLKCGYSKISQDLFYKLIEIYDIEDREMIYFATKNKEYFISLKGGEFYQYDFTDLKRKKIIEYNGDLYHANPNIYKSGDFPHPFRKNESFEYLREKDKKKLEAAEKKGFVMLTIWDSDYKNNKEETIQRCINFLNS